MNHQKNNGRKLERDRNGRRALVKSLLGSLVIHEKIQTTEAKAKEAKSRIDRIVNRAKEARDAADPVRRVSILRQLRTLVPGVALKKLSDNAFLALFDARKSGYARVVKLSPRRGDGAKIAFVEFVR